MTNKIGQTAGEVWRLLEKNHQITLAQLKKKISGSPDLINQSLGWLAREGKVNIEEKGKSVKISLN